MEDVSDQLELHGMEIASGDEILDITNVEDINSGSSSSFSESSSVGGGDSLQSTYTQQLVNRVINSPFPQVDAKTKPPIYRVDLIADGFKRVLIPAVCFRGVYIYFYLFMLFIYFFELILQYDNRGRR
jgi:hypothetical protein